MKSKELLLSFFCLLGATFTGWSQIDVDDTFTVEDLVNEVLLGEGVNAFNITYNGLPGDQATLQTGTFDASGTTFLIDSGVVMASSVINTINTGGGENNGFDFENFPDSSDVDLAAISGFPSRNACVIEFDFTVASDSVKFDYIFASAEYPGFTCSSFNDVFGFFLSGPGISGPYTSPAGFPDGAKNIALVPNTDDIAVGVNSINSGFPQNDPDCLAANPNYEDDSIYFVSNDPPDPNGMQIPGHTVILTAEEAIQCGETYHIKLAICNSSDEFLQSAVFLEAGSFSAFGDVFVEVNPTIGGAPVLNPDFEDVLVAGCSEAFIELIRPPGLEVSDVTVTFGGTAVEGEDYIFNGVPIFTFPDGVDTLAFTIETLYDGTPGEGEILVISITYFDNCGEEVTASAEIEIVDPYFITSETEDVVVVCPADSVVVTAQGLGGIPPYSYEWDDEGPGSSVWVDMPPDQQYYYVNIGDACTESFGFTPIVDSVLVVNNIPPPLEVSIDPFFQPECPNEPINLSAAVLNGNPAYQYDWFDSRGFTYPNGANILVENVNPNLAGYIPDVDVFLTITDSCGTVVQDSTQIFYPLYDSLSVVFGPLTDNCPEEPVELEAETAGGAGDFTYLWSITEGDGNFASGFGPQTRVTFVEPAGGFNTFEILARDKCNLAGHDMFIGVSPDGDPLFSGLASYDIRIPIIELDNLPNVITPNGDNQNDFFVVEGIEVFEDSRVEIFDRWGRLIYETDNYMAGSPDVQPDDAFDAQDYDDGTYFYIINIDSGECTATGSLQVLGSND
jgi:gliding motility-associated-like protein